MSSIEILFNKRGHAKSPVEISRKITRFGNSYNNTVAEIIKMSSVLDPDGKTFVDCASKILSNFGMTRRGPFQNDRNQILQYCWDQVGTKLLDINKSVLDKGVMRDRYLLSITIAEREKIIEKIWVITKELLPFTMGKSTFGLVGASKILFSVLPEIVLPVDNAQWLHVFKTVDLGDIINFMASDIQMWEMATGIEFNTLDQSNQLTTLPSVYNVIAMGARP